MRRAVAIVGLYVLAYCVASFLDLLTTALAVAIPGVHEQNLFSTKNHFYVAGRAWVITLAGGVMMVGSVIFAFRNADRVEPQWLRRPVHSFASFYVNPFSKRAVGRSPLHMLCFAVAFIGLRLLAAENNVLIAAYGFAPIGIPIRWIGERSSPLIGFVAVMIPLFYALALVISPVCARTMLSWRTPHGEINGSDLVV